MADYDNPRPTSQPIGSTDLVVAKDNLITLDRMVSGPSGTPVSNRKGEQLTPLVDIIDSANSKINEAVNEAIGASFGVFIGNYPQTYTNYNQYTVFNGQQYGIKTPSQGGPDLPYTPTEADPANDANLKIYGDASQSFVRTSVTVGQEELLANGSEIFPKIGNLENGMIVPSGTTHLRVSGQIYVMSPVSSGLVTDLTPVGATIGVVGVTFNLPQNEDVNAEKYHHLVVNGMWSDAVNAALIEASIKGVNCLLPRQAFEPKYDKTVVVPKGVALIGRGIAKWVAVFADIDVAPTTMLFTGTGAKTYQFDNIGSLSASGGHIANPDANQPYSANAHNDFYEFTDLTNGDAVGAQRATLKSLSVAVELKDNARLIGVRVVPDYNGIAGYLDTSLTGLGADWDIGVLENQSRGSGGQFVQVAGYWRVAGLFKAYQTKASTSDFTNAEDSNWYKSMFQGYRGFLGRGNDTYKVTAATATTITIPWDKSHCFETQGTIRVSGTDYSYTHLSFSSGNLIFTVADASNVSVGDLLRKAGSNFGSSGSQFIDCEIHDLMHSSRLMSNSTEMDSPFLSSSACYEISGEPSRAIQFTCCTILGRDDVVALSGNCRDIVHIGTYFESANGRLLKSDDIFSGTLANGGRYIALNGDGLVTANLRFIAHTDSFLDFTSPAQGNTVPPRFSTGGLFNPREFFNDKYDLRTALGELRIGSEARQTRLYAKDNVLIQDATGNGTIKSGAGSLQLFSGLRARIGKSASDCVIIDSDKLTPSDNGVKALGQPATTFKEIYLRDAVSNQSVRVRVESGALVVTAV